jgi:hypothetical protein
MAKASQGLSSESRLVSTQVMREPMTPAITMRVARLTISSPETP